MKGIVTEISNNHAIILNQNGEFVRVSDRGYTIGQRVSRRKTNFAALSTIAASIAIFCMLSVTGYAIYYTPDAYISIDINPSMQLTVNRFGRIIDVETFNQDAEIVLNEADVKNHSYQSGIEEIIDKSKELGYLSETKNEVVIDVVSKDENIVLNINSKTKKYQDEGFVINIEKSNEDEVALSKELGISLGRTKAISEYTKANGGDVKENKEKLDNLSVGDIKKDNIKESKESKAAEKVKENNDRNNQPNNTQTPSKAKNDNDNATNNRGGDGQENKTQSNAETRSKGGNSDNSVNNQAPSKSENSDNSVSTGARSSAQNPDSFAGAAEKNKSGNTNNSANAGEQSKDKNSSSKDDKNTKEQANGKDKNGSNGKAINRSN